MWKRLCALIRKYREILAYLFFGGCTTLVNMAVYYLLGVRLEIATMPATAIAWVAAVLFAYVTNKLWVFGSRSADSRVLLRETLTFFGFRLLSYLVGAGLMWLMIDRLLYNTPLWKMIWKLVANVIEVIVNYAASKLVVFRKK